MIIRNKIIIIQGRPWEGKTFFASLIWSCYRRIYSNVDIYKNWRIISNKITNIKDLKDINFSTIKWVVILDEWGININARDSASKENREYWELWMLWRKLNVDIVICAQLGRMIDVYFRELANFRFEMHAWFERKNYLMFEAKIFSGGSDDIRKVVRLDLFEFARMSGITYDTLESSRIWKKEKKIPSPDVLNTPRRETQAKKIKPPKKLKEITELSICTI